MTGAPPSSAQASYTPRRSSSRASATHLRLLCTHGVLRRLRQSDLRAVRDNGIHDRVKYGELWNRERSLLRLSAEKAPHLASLSGLLPSLEKSALPPSGSGPPGSPREYRDGPGSGYSTVPPGTYRSFGTFVKRANHKSQMLYVLYHTSHYYYYHKSHSPIISHIINTESYQDH